jgi:hypothetical protein
VKKNELATDESRKEKNKNKKKKKKANEKRWPIGFLLFVGANLVVGDGETQVRVGALCFCVFLFFIVIFFCRGFFLLQKQLEQLKLETHSNPKPKLKTQQQPCLDAEKEAKDSEREAPSDTERSCETTFKASPSPPFDDLPAEVA